jgi:Ca2+-transporting ATPase
LQHCGVDPQHGLEAAQVDQRRAMHGPNALPEAPPRPLWRTFARQFSSPLIYILFAAAMIAVGLGHYGDAGVILAVVIVNALIGSFPEGRAERSMASLRRLAALHARVLRDGHKAQIEARELVPGDILLLAAGDAVGADARLLQQAQLQMAEATLTGESVPVAKTLEALPEATGLADRHNFVYAGTHVSAGRARAVVVATGAHTEVGRIAGLTERAEEPKTPLELRIEQFGRWLVAAALGLFVVVVLLGLWRELPLAEVLMVAISQMVSMVPEGLPVAKTIALAVGMQRMAARGAIIRRLSAVETLGSTTTICSDKTGTLTRNEMTVTGLWLPDAVRPAGREINVSGIGYAPEGALREGQAAAASGDAALRELLCAAALCNDAQLLPPEDERRAWTVLGDPTEGALLVLARKAGIEIDTLHRQASREVELPVDSETELMATRHRLADAPRHIYIKGAPEAVLQLCARDDAPRSEAARAAAETMALRAWRVLAFAAVDDDLLDAAASFGALTGRVRLLGLAGQIDPPREEVRAAVAECRAAGIRTGDGDR